MSSETTYSRCYIEHWRRIWTASILRLQYQSTSLSTQHHRLHVISYHYHCN